MQIRGLRAQFKSRDIEGRYRSHYLKQDTLQVNIGIIVFCIATLTFIRSDYLLFGISGEFYLLLIIRGIIILVSIITITANKINKNNALWDWIIFFWQIVICSSVVIINITRPPEYLQHSFINILIMLFIYVLFQNRLIMQTAIAILFSIGNIAIILLLSTTITQVSIQVIVISYLVGNFLGFFISWHLHLTRRKQYRAWLNEKQLKDQLQEAMTKIKTLSGLLPICSSCKKIRDTEGYWKQIEEYIETHSDAQFSHGLCMECAEKLYGDKEWFKKEDK